MNATWLHPANGPPSIHVKRDTHYNLISWAFVDVDRPHPYDRSDTPFLMYARVNAPCSKNALDTLNALGEEEKSELIGYLPPSIHPIPHCYQLIVLGHANPINSQHERELLIKSGRKCWDMKSFQERSQGTVLHRRFFMHSTGDAGKKDL